MAGGITITTYEPADYLRRMGKCIDGETLAIPKSRVPSIAEVQAIVAAHFHIRVEYMRSAHRSREVARPRQVAMYLARQLTPRSMPEIGRRFGGRDHTTVIHACKQVARLILEDPEFASQVNGAAAELMA